MSNNSSSLPPPRPDQTYVSISPIVAGKITIPEKFFVHPADPEAKNLVPSLAFLITHPNPPSSGSALSKIFNLAHPTASSSTSASAPARTTTPPRSAATLQTGGLAPTDIDTILFSHVHYDHHGDPAHFPSSRFLVGPGATRVLKEGLGGLASHQHFDAALLPPDPARSQELPPYEAWGALGPFERALDLFGDGSVWAVDAPGHLPGHVNLLCRVSAERWVYLGGDAAHDVRLISGKKEIATWQGDEGQEVCIHLDREAARETIRRIRELKEREEGRVEVVIAHDARWVEENQGRMFPNTM